MFNWKAAGKMLLIMLTTIVGLATMFGMLLLLAQVLDFGWALGVWGGVGLALVVVATGFAEKPKPSGGGTGPV